MPSFFGAVTGKTSATLFEIRLDSDIIVLRGSENEASSQILRGVVVLCLPSALKVEDVHLRLTGQMKVEDVRLTPSVTSNERPTEIFNHRWPPFVGGGAPGSSSKGTILPPGNYEWPFELVIPGDMAESVEGLPESFIMYRLKATVARGKLAYDLHAWKPVRIIRTLDPSALELAHAMTLENVWTNKIEYQLVIPQKAIIFGTTINLQMRFTPLLKGLKIGQVKCQLVENQEFTAPNGGAFGRSWRTQRDIGDWTFEMNDEEHYHDVLNESGQDGYKLDAVMPLPKSLSECLQDVDVHGIKIRHKVKFNIALRNPDGHVSELRANLPVTIFISPNMPLTEDGCLVDQTPMSVQSADIGQHAPPLYGEHVLDQLYADVDQTGFMTPAPQSGMNTPFYIQSRVGSSENLPLDDTTVTTNGAVPPGALSSRLQNLDLRNNSSNPMAIPRRSTANGSTLSSGHATPSSYPTADPSTSASHTLPSQPDPSTQTSTSNPQSRAVSRRTSDDENALISGRHSPEHIDFTDLTDLSKVPSYATAVRTPARGLSCIEQVPDYEVVVSRRGSAEGGSGSSVGVGGVDVPRAGAGSGSGNGNGHGGENGNGSGSGRGWGRGTRTLSARHSPTWQPGDEDERWRLHFLRNRDRGHRVV